jgi:hypothetical protein
MKLRTVADEGAYSSKDLSSQKFTDPFPAQDADCGLIKPRIRFSYYIRQTHHHPISTYSLISNPAGCFRYCYGMLSTSYHVP